MTDQTPWCCTGRVSECPLCPEYGTRVIDPCPGHPVNDNTQTVVDTARLHAARRHPGYQYATTTGPRKQWDDAGVPPYGDNGEPDPSWEPNLDAGHPGAGWERFDYTEEAYWRRPKTAAVEPSATEATERAKSPLREQIAAAIYEKSNPGYRWADAHPDDVLAYGTDADAALKAIEGQLDLGEAEAWCKICRRVWGGPRHQCESDAEQALARVVAALPPYSLPTHGDRSEGVQMGWDLARQAALDAIEQPAAPEQADSGPTVTECRDADRAHWNDKHAEEPS